MFGPNFFIDTFQTTKKTVTDRIISDPVLNKAAHNYIDAQTTFAKMVVDNTITFAKYSVDTATKCMFPQKEQASQAPYKVEKEAE